MFWTFSCRLSASTSNLPCLLFPFGLPRAISPLQRPIRHACSSLLDFLVPSLRFNVQSARLLVPFGLQHTFPPLQCPIRHACSSFLDFLVPSLCFNVQSAALARPFWTFSFLPSALTSNLPRNIVPFGLPRAFPPLQRPIRHACSSLLDFLVPSLRFNVQSTMFSRPFWTSAYLPSASTSNPPCLLVPFGLQHTFPPLQRPICHACSSLLDFLVPSLCFNVQSAVLARPFWTSAYLPSASTSNPPHLPHQSDSPLVHRKKGVKKLTLPHSLFPMDQRGVEPLSENPFPVLLLS